MFIESKKDRMGQRDGFGDEDRDEEEEERQTLDVVVRMAPLPVGFNFLATVDKRMQLPVRR